VPVVLSVNVSDGGVPKRPVAEAFVGRQGLRGDRQGDRRYHGGPARAVSLYSAELLAALRLEGHLPEPGDLGENLTLSGLEWPLLAPGRQLRAGAALLELTSYAPPCRKLAACFAGGDVKRVAQTRNPGWSRLYARVIEEGLVRTGDPVELLPNDRTSTGPR
jgi:MOSC domain-containing protein YiiM